MVERARTQLVAAKASADELDAFDARTDIAALIEADRPLAEAISITLNLTFISSNS